MPVEPDSVNSRSQTDQLLDRLESQWLRNEIPDIASYLRSPSSPDSALWHSLIELDLEYRWKRFRADGSTTERDVHGFHQFPRLEDYAELLDVSHRHLILTPELLAEEYRVRRSWGDRPDKQDYLSRLPLDSVAVESALNQIDTEFEIERATPVEEEDSSSLADESTWLVKKQNKPEPERTGDVDVPRSMGKYELKTLIGRGGFGEVWKAYDPDLKRYVALKFPRRDKHFTAEALKFFRSEAQKMATLERVPGIVPVYEAGEVGGKVYIVSYLVQGQDLGKIYKRGELSHEEAAQIIAEVADTLHRAHLKNLFHRDVKLSNILIGDDKDIFLSDFGLCISEEEQLKEGRSTTGTYAYMAPEQVQGFSHRLDGRADIYGLGVVLYRLLTGRLPFVADTPQEYLEQVLHREPRPPRSIKDEIPAELERICLKCLNKDIKDRYTTAADLAQELREWNAVRQEDSQAQKNKPLFVAMAVVLAGITIWFLPRYLIPETIPPTQGPKRPPSAPPTAATDPNRIDVEVLIFPEKSADSIWQPLNEGGSLQVHSDWLSLLKLGETEDQVSLEADISQLKWTGQIGFFYGYQENIVKGFLQASYYVVEIVPEGDSKYRLVHSHKRHWIQNPSVVESDLLESARIGSIETRAVNLKIILSQITKCETFYNGDLMVWDQPALEQQYNAIDVSGSYGIYNYVSSGTFHNLIVDGVVRSFRKSEE